MQGLLCWPSDQLISRVLWNQNSASWNYDRILRQNHYTHEGGNLRHIMKVKEILFKGSKLPQIKQIVKAKIFSDKSNQF